MRLPAFVSNRRPIVLAASFSLLSAVSASAGTLDAIEKEVATVYSHCKNAVVKVHAKRQIQLQNLPTLPSHRVGTAFFVDDSGLLLTSRTVVQDADTCWIDWKGERVPAKVLGRDPVTNLALLKVTPEACGAESGKTPVLPLGDSDELRVGSMVIAIGYPFNYALAPEVGFVNALDTEHGGLVFITTHIRASCQLKPGQSGGPLLNPRGEVVGIAVAAHQSGQSYAVPINAARRVYTDLLQFGEARHGWVGLGIGERRVASGDAGRELFEVVIQQVFSNTPAATAGFQDGDILQMIATNQVRRMGDVLNRMFYYRSGDRVQFKVLREGEEKNITLTVGTRPEEEMHPAQVRPQLPYIGPPSRSPTMVPASEER